MLINRYLFKNLGVVTLSVTLILTAIIWLTQSLKLLEIMVNSDAPFLQFIKLVALSLPHFLIVVLPIALVCAVLFVYHRMILDNELIVMRAVGLDHAEIAKPAITLGLIITLALFSMTLYLSPLATGKMEDLKYVIKTQYSSFLLREGVFNTLSTHVTVYFRKRTRDGDLLGLFIHDTREKDQPPVTVTAKRGRLLLEEGDPHVVVYDGMREQMDAKANTMTRLHFEEYSLSVTDLGGPEKARRKSPSELGFHQLFTQTPNSKMTSQALKSEAHIRLVTPIYALSLTMMALAVLLTGPFNRRGHTARIWVAAILAILLEISHLSFVHLIKKYPFMIACAYLSAFGPGVIALYILEGKGRVFLRIWRNLSRMTA